MLNKLHEFSLFGGPLYRLGSRLGLVNHDKNTVKLGVALGLLTWGVMILLLFVDGAISQIFSLSVIGAHVRLLIVIPMLFICESSVLPRMSSFISFIIEAGLVAPSSLPNLNNKIAQINKWKDSWVPEAVFVLIAAMLTLTAQDLHLYGTTAAVTADKITELAMAPQWYLVVCLTLFRFLMIRWLWHLGMWCFILWHISRLELNLIPTHPDGVAGLGYLEIVHGHFTSLVFALSALQAAMLTEEIAANRMDFVDVYPAIMLTLIVGAVLFLGPLFIFSSKLWACKVKGLSDYMVLSSQYVRDFDNKWLRNKASTKDELLGNSDLQSLSDLNASMAIVRNMRWVAISIPLLVSLLSATFLPMLPLLLLKYPMTALAEKFITNLLGF